MVKIRVVMTNSYLLQQGSRSFRQQTLGISKKIYRYRIVLILYNDSLRQMTEVQGICATRPSPCRRTGRALSVLASFSTLVLVSKTFTFIYRYSVSTVRQLRVLLFRESSST
jgi:hypothetical protein